MVKYTNDELLEMLPSSIRETKELTSKQKVVLGQLLIYNGLEKVKRDGYFYRSNQDLCTDCEIQEKTLISAVRKLESLGFIERKKGSRTSGASEYRLNEQLISDYSKTQVEKSSNDYSEQISAMSDRIKELEITVKRLVERITVIEGRNYSTETELDKELDIEKDNSNILNNNTLLNIEYNIEESENTKELEIAESPLEVKTNEDGQTFIPNAKEKEELEKWNKLINPYLLKVLSATTDTELNTIHSNLIQAVNDKYDEWGYPYESVKTYLNERIIGYFKSRKKDIEEIHTKQINQQLKQHEQYASYY